MIAVDTNLLLRLVLDDAPEQQNRVNALLRTGQLFTAPATVLLELVWVLQAYDRSDSQIALGLQRLLALPNFWPDARDEIEAAVTSFEQGMDFADALHLALAARCEGMVTFDKAFAKSAKKLKLAPPVALL